MATRFMERDRRRALQVWIALNRAQHAIDAPLRAQVEAHGLTMKQFAVLEVLLHKGPLPVGEVGERVLLTSGSMTYVLDQLEDEGMLVRRADPNDGRVQQVALTDTGREFVEQVFPEHAQLLQSLMDALSTPEKETLFRLLHRLRDNAA
ncbi:MAG: MarR family transcriptional regulator [Longimonas sp.]|uniref:MarR family winged helix-turn-helix transcriptional regulator n=1 Tax=Longimonas sp. TaxID=2039626 RepID=UPI00397481BF